MSAAVKERQPGAYVIFEHLAAASEEKQLGDAGILLWRNKNEAYCETAMGWSGSKPIFLVYLRGHPVCLLVV